MTVAWRVLPVLLGVLGAFVALGSSTAAQVPSFSPDDPRASFAAMAEYLARDGGRWRGENPNHDGSPFSPPHFGLWFDQHLGGRVLELRIVVHFPDSTVVSSRGRFVWHPEKGQVDYEMIGRNGSVTEGVVSFPTPTMFTTVATQYRWGRPPRAHRDDNVAVGPDLHRNESFEQDEAGNWVSLGAYEWRREQGGAPGSRAPTAGR